jgi:very-long-chain enoyl-CoA reductase
VQVVRLGRGDKTLGSYNITRDSTLIVKDLGPQIGYRTVFVVEYAGPIAIMLLYAARPAFIFGDKAASQPWNDVAFAAVIAWILHFLKREFVSRAPSLCHYDLWHLHSVFKPYILFLQETFFVHKFSRPTMPMSNLFKNSIYYWGFAAMVGYPLCSPDYTAPESKNQVCRAVLVVAKRRPPPQAEAGLQLLFGTFVVLLHVPALYII